MKNKIIIALISLTCFTSYAQKEITWQDLANITFERKYFPIYDEYFLYPYFSSDMKALEGKEVTITGYFLDIDPKGEIFILSKGPMSSCFFCGIGGPETAIELHFSSKPSFKMDDVVTITGTLKLNSEDINHFNYILNTCEGELAN
ncbi:hypothetical protein [Winogradskyella sp.]|uniref:hypothetical protein n=1 Tax=Winogradskyella sp. TaxID=1883156 RepID=UPI002603306C|nr:hypothetical protein [Winogradskyella sp.]